jgi:cyanophycin synthetase
MHVYGFHQGLAQSSMLLKVSWPNSPSVDVGRLDAWFKDYLGIEPPQAGGLISASAQASCTPVALDLLASVLAVYGWLCRASHMPCVELGGVARLERHESTLKITLAVPTVNGVSPDVFKHLLQVALRVVDALLAKEPSTLNAQAIYDYVEQQVLSRYKDLLPGGRANSFVASLGHKLGVPFEYIGAELMQLGHGARRQITQRSACLADSAIAALASSDKVSTALLLRQAGLPAPVHSLVGSIEQAQQVARQLGWPVVVKPADRERSEGVTIDVDNPDKLEQAYKAALKFSQRILVERQVAGVCHRILVVGQQFVYAMKRQPKSVKGDGVQTIRQLVEAANAVELNKPTWARMKPWVLDQLGIECLAKFGLTPDSVLAHGQLAALRPITSDEWGGSGEEVTETIHPDNVQLAIEAAQIMGMKVAGVDLMSTDISLPWHETGAIINEVNYKPFVSGSLDKNKVDSYIQAVMGGLGRIPVHAVVGDGDVWEVARALGRTLKQAGTASYLCGKDLTESPNGEPYHMACSGLFMRCRALLHNPNVEALVMVLDSDEFLTTGLPLDRIEALHVAGGVDQPCTQQLKEAIECALSKKYDDNGDHSN